MTPPPISNVYSKYCFETIKKHSVQKLFNCFELELVRVVEIDSHIRYIIFNAAVARRRFVIYGDSVLGVLQDPIPRQSFDLFIQPRRFWVLQPSNLPLRQSFYPVFLVSFFFDEHPLALLRTQSREVIHKTFFFNDLSLLRIGAAQDLP